ncbi:DUF1338 domain-containing protein [uncultured Polaribacter sp.]|uniref:DUF1338 domain-containing protein n=1 Tax=uncultured Polaribacter sp. TaxID=174711 RepID=UPI00260AD90B|nr:DUF1338 domain-containing protein [uncultured Polaribacter sp.]
MSVLEQVLDKLMTTYREKVPSVSIINKALIAKGVIAVPEDIENDHIAFRTMGVAHLGIQSLEKIFLHYGYKAEDHYVFEKKKLKARWYAPPENKFPRIFISELKVAELSEATQQIIKSYTNEVKADPVDDLNLNDANAVGQFLHSPLWRTPLSADYKSLLAESEYAAWVIYNRYYLNHYTINVDNLPEGYNNLKDFNTFLVDIGVVLSDAGGIIKESKDGLLLQSSTVSELCNATFSAGDQFEIAGSYVEFAERRVLPEFSHLPKNEIKRIYRREGFEAANADKIFESTYTSQTKNNKLK